MSDIEKLRKEMETITTDMLKLLKLRTEISKEIGNLKNDSIENVINNVAAQKLRSSMLSRGKLHPTCQKCQANPINSKQ